MKNANKHMDLDQLLTTLEHAGRDSRRQQELSAMIDNMAKAEVPKKHDVWWWCSRVAVAACVTFFITTAVRLFSTSDPATNGVTTVAELTSTEIPSSTSHDTIVVNPTIIHNKTSHTPVAIKTDPTPVSEELYAEVATETEPAEEVSTEEYYNIILDDFAPDSEPIAYKSEQDHTPTEAPTANNEASSTTPNTDTPVVAQSVKPQRRRLLGGFLRRSEPSRMEGTTLALLQF